MFSKLLMCFRRTPQELHPVNPTAGDRTFIDVWGQASDEDLARVTLYALSVLVREAVWRPQAHETLIAALVVRETILHGEER